MKTGSELIVEERQRQIEMEGWTAQHDDEHLGGELSAAAICYTVAAHGLAHGLRSQAHAAREMQSCWPFEKQSWKPSDDPIRNLAKAGALIAAEIDRLQRLENEKDEGRETNP